MKGLWRSKQTNALKVLSLLPGTGRPDDSLLSICPGVFSELVDAFKPYSEMTAAQFSIPVREVPTALASGMPLSPPHP